LGIIGAGIISWGIGYYDWLLVLFFIKLLENLEIGLFFIFCYFLDWWNCLFNDSLHL
jgi:hypothetical protein